jgi:spermidine/putrescine transport system permease protein
MSAKPTSFDWRRTPGLPSFTALIIAFLYAPLLVLVIYSFNASRMTTVWAGFSLQWFVQVAHNADIRGAALNSLIIAWPPPSPPPRSRRPARWRWSGAPFPSDAAW